jgi:hypothetical protein
VFTGIIDTMTPTGSVTNIKLITSLQLLRDLSSGGLGMDNEAVSVEAAWSLLRFCGIDAEQNDFEGFEPGPSETFEVATSLDGIELTQTIGLGEVLLLPPGIWSRLTDGLGPDELWQAFAEATA